LLRRLRATFATFPEITEERAWAGLRWQVGKATVAHVFGGEDQRFRVTIRAELDEVLAFEHLGEPYLRARWGSNVVGLLIDDGSDWDEIAALLLTDSYCIQGPNTPRRAGPATGLNWASHESPPARWPIWREAAAAEVFSNVGEWPRPGGSGRRRPGLLAAIIGCPVVCVLCAPGHPTPDAPSNVDDGPCASATT
jgi:hypothetical protein